MRFPNHSYSLHSIFGPRGLARLPLHVGRVIPFLLERAAQFPSRLGHTHSSGGGHAKRIEVCRFLAVSTLSLQPGLYGFHCELGRLLGGPLNNKDCPTYTGIVARSFQGEVLPRQSQSVLRFCAGRF
jgi:hypothetical protein